MLLRMPLLALVLGLVATDGLAARPARAAGASVVGKLTWYGQSCFLLETAAGTRILMDPIPKGIGYELPAGLRPDAITISHDHADHANLAMAANKPRVIRGLTADHKGWARVDDKVKDVAIRTVGVYHDDKRGAERGLDTVFIFEVGGLRIAHLGDLGHTLTDEQRTKIGAVDVLPIPVGGTFTVDARTATRVVEQLRPRLMVVPMHYKTDAVTIKELEPLDLFLEGKVAVRRETARTLPLSPLKPRAAAETVVLPYR